MRRVHGILSIASLILGMASPFLLRAVIDTAACDGVQALGCEPCPEGSPSLSGEPSGPSMEGCPEMIG